MKYRMTFDPFRAGYAARKRGARLSDCPLWERDESEERARWEMGWEICDSEIRTTTRLCKNRTQLLILKRTHLSVAV